MLMTYTAFVQSISLGCGIRPVGNQPLLNFGLLGTLLWLGLFAGVVALSIRNNRKRVRRARTS